MIDPEITLSHALTTADLQAIFKFSEADLLANRRGQYSGAQHRLRGVAVGLIGVCILVILSVPIQQSVGDALGWVAAPCFAGIGLAGLLAGISGLAAAWSTLREGVTAPIVKYSGHVNARQQGDAAFLESDAFKITIDSEAAEQFSAGDYIVYYVPNYVADRARLFSIEPALT